MKKKESLWQLLQRLDEEAGQFNSNLSEANRHFDTTARETNALLMQQKKKLHTTILKVKRALKIFSKRKNTKPKNGKK
jgi:hypothetical protein